MSGVIKASEDKEQTRNYILMIFTQLPIKKSIYMLQALKKSEIITIRKSTFRETLCH